MKAYLIFSIITLALAIITPASKEPPSEAVKAWAQLLRLGCLGWAIYLLCQL